MATFVVAHGAWSGGWAWKKLRPLIAERGHQFFTPTNTGLGDRHHHAHRGVDLETHIRDMLAMLAIEDLREVYLVAHSYGGMVGTAVADRARDRIRHLIYVDAFVPEAGKALHDYVPAERREAALKNAIDGWQVPTPPPPPDTLPEDLAWITPRRLPQPVQCFEQKFVLQNGPLTLPRTYIYAQRHNPGDPFRQFMERARKEGWPVYEMDVSHSPNVTAPEALMEILEKVAASA